MLVKQHWQSHVRDGRAGASRQRAEQRMAEEVSAIFMFRIFPIYLYNTMK